MVGKLRVGWGPRRTFWSDGGHGEVEGSEIAYEVGERKRVGIKVVPKTDAQSLCGK